MGRASERAHLLRLLESHARTIRETYQMFDRPAAPSLEKVDWSEVTKLGDEVSKQATVAGMLWSGETPNVKELEENMSAYCNILQGFLLLCHGTTVGSGPTLLACTHSSAKQVTERSLSLLREAISSYGSCGSHKKASIPHLSGSVWDACSALKKTPMSNSVAVGRAITQVAVSIKDVLREMKELKPAASSSADKSTAEASDESCETSEVEGLDDDDDFGSDLSLEEMHVAQLVKDIVSDALVVMKELIRFLTLLLKGSNVSISSRNDAYLLERLLKCCREIGSQIDELGACVYPPQEVSSMKSAAEKIKVGIQNIRELFLSFEGSAQSLTDSFEGLESSLKKLQSELGSVDRDMVTKLEKLDL